VAIVLGFRDGRLVDVTTQYRPWLRQKLTEAKQLLLDGLDESGEDKLTADRAQGMIQYYAVALLLHNRATARRMVLDLLPQRDRPDFVENYGLIERVLADRRKRYAYPAAFSSAQAFESEAIPPPDSGDAVQADNGATDAGTEGVETNSP
jgi:hypothetical protein